MSDKKKITAKEFDERFDAGESLLDLGVELDTEIKPVNIALPRWAVNALDEEATRRGVARQALMKMWLVDRLDALKSKGEVNTSRARKHLNRLLNSGSIG